MADLPRYTDFGLEFGTIASPVLVPFEPGTLESSNEPNKEGIKSGGTLNDDLQVIHQKAPLIRVTILDPSLVTEWQKVGVGETITSVKAIWRAYEVNNALGAGHVHSLISEGVIHPVSLTASQDTKATMEVVCWGLFNAGAALAVGTDTGGPGTVAKVYKPTSAVIGGTTITELKSFNVSWDFGKQDNDKLEPEEIYYDRFTQRGTIVAKDFAYLSALRIEDEETQTVTLNLTDLLNGANTIAIVIGSCKISTAGRSDEVVIDFEKLG